MCYLVVNVVIFYQFQCFIVQFIVFKYFIGVFWVYVLDYILLQILLSGGGGIVSLCEFFLFQCCMGLWNMVCQVEYQVKCQFCGGIGIVFWGVEYLDVVCLGGLGINIYWICVGVGDYLQVWIGGYYCVCYFIIVGYQYFGVVGQFNQLIGVEFWFVQCLFFYQQFVQLVEGVKVVSMFGGKNDFYGCRF